jgi:DNA-binding PadR family transcriptional regulator
MNDQEIRKLLEQLHGEVDNIDTIDEKGRELLRDLGNDIDELLARSENVGDESGSVAVRRLEDTISYLEVSHPTLTSTLAELLAVLSNAGI